MAERAGREPALTDNARRIFDLRYSLKDAEGNPTETPAESIRRVAENIAAVTLLYQDWDPTHDSGYMPENEEVYDFPVKTIVRQWNYLSRGNVIPDIEELAATGIRQWKLRTKKYVDLLTDLRLVPNSPTWTGAGTPLSQLAACFVLPISDDLGRARDSIFETMKVAALIQQTGGGNGFDFSSLRPSGTLVSRSMGQSSGPVSFLKVYDTAFGSIAQGGSRRGANMAVMSVHHPDVLKFIESKVVEGEISNFNISVAITDAFMRAVIDDGTHYFEWPLGQPCAEMPARELFDILTQNAWVIGDPGSLFVDAANRQNPCPTKYTLAATNPCGEQWLPPYSNCCLGAIAVNRFVKNDYTFDWKGLQDTVALSVGFLDDVIDANRYVPEVPELEAAAMAERRIGLGVMGVADALILLGVPYDSPDGLSFVDQLMEFIRFHAMLASINRAAERGSFEWIEHSIYDPNLLKLRGEGTLVEGRYNWKRPTSIFTELLEGQHRDYGRPHCDWDRVYEGICKHGIRNACQMTVAPTGTTSNVAGLEGSGIEPLFSISYTRKVMQEGQNIDLEYYSPLYQGALDSGWDQDRLDYVFRLAGDINPIDHINMQAVCQAWVDNAISKTINLPHEATVEDVADCYKHAWGLGCKGITVYRQGSRDLEVLSAKHEEPLTVELTIGQTIEADEWPQIAPVKVPAYVSTEGLPARAFEIETPFGTMQVYITELRDHRGRPFDIRLQIGKAGNDKHADVETIGRMASVALRAGVHVSVLVNHLEGIGGQSVFGFGDKRVRSVGDGLGKLLRSLYLDAARPETALVGDPPPDPAERTTAPQERNLFGVCPKCKNATMVMESGCQHCEIRLGGCGEYSACD